MFSTFSTVSRHLIYFLFKKTLNKFMHVTLVVILETFSILPQPFLILSHGWLEHMYLFVKWKDAFIHLIDQRIDREKKLITTPQSPFLLCIGMCHFCHILPFLFLYVVSLQLQEIKNKTKQKNNPLFYFLNFNITIKASAELPFCYCSDNSQQWQVRGKF